MKHLKILIAVMMVMGLSSHADSSNNPWQSLLVIDTRTSAGGGMVG
jgi:hypothetical protein